MDDLDDPKYSTAAGLVLYGFVNQPERKFRIRDGNIFQRVVNKMKSWFSS
jgi:cell division protein FtsA